MDLFGALLNHIHTPGLEMRNLGIRTKRIGHFVRSLNSAQFNKWGWSRAEMSRTAQRISTIHFIDNFENVANNHVSQLRLMKCSPFRYRICLPGMGEGFPGRRLIDQQFRFNNGEGGDAISKQPNRFSPVPFILQFTTLENF